MKSEEVPEVTEEIENDLRDEYDEIILSSGSASAGGCLHLPVASDGAGILCDSELKRHQDCNLNGKGKRVWIRKSVAVYPPGFKPFCKLCVKRWQEINQIESESGFGCEECDRNAIGLIKVENNTLYLCRYHYRKARSEYKPAIDESRLFPVGDDDE